MILCSGCFDGLHAGHVRYLQAARKLCEPGEALYVAVAPDSYIRIAKGRKAHWGQSDRVETVRALKIVHAVFHQDSDSAAAAIRQFRPRIFVKGSDWWTTLPAEIYEACAQSGSYVQFVDTPGKHTSEAMR